MIGEENARTSLNPSKRKHALKGVYDVEYFPVKDNRMLSEVASIIQSIVNFIESTFYLNISVIRVKFEIAKETGMPVFIGANDCVFQFKTLGKSH